MIIMYIREVRNMVKVEVTEEIKEKIIKALEKYSVKELTQLLNLSRGTIERILKSQNVRILRRTYGKIKKLEESNE